MTQPQEPPAHGHANGDPFWNDGRDGSQPVTPESLVAWRDAMGDQPSVVVRRWLPGEEIDPSQIQGTFIQDDFSRATDQAALGPSWQPYTGPTDDEVVLYDRMRERQARNQPAITRRELERQGLIPPSRALTQEQVGDEVAALLGQGFSPETVAERLREMGFEFHGYLGPEGIIQREPERLDTTDVYAAIRATADNQLAALAQTPPADIVPLEDLAGPNEHTVHGYPANRAERRGQPQRCACGHPNNPGGHSRDRCRGETTGERSRRLVEEAIGPAGDPYTQMMPWGGEVRIVGHDPERNMVDVEFTSAPTPVGRDGDPLTAIRTRPLAGGGAVGAGGGGGGAGTYPRQSTTWAAGGAAGAGGGAGGRGSGFGMTAVAGTGETLRDRLMRHGVTEATPNLDDDIEVAPMEPRPVRYVAPESAKRAKAHMDEIFADLLDKSKGELVDLITAMRADWEALNDIHNRRANRSGWCSEYEERQERHNESFHALKLLGRIVDGPSDEYSGGGPVKVTVTAEINGEARSYTEEIADATMRQDFTKLLARCGDKVEMAWFGKKWTP